jgi:uncharacterized protein (TIGR03435 family)
MEFEVASIKPTAIDPAGIAREANSGGLRVGARVYGDRAEYIYMTLRQLIAEAYEVSSYQLVGPEWLTSDRFDVVCKLPPGSRKEDAPFMLQALLADRFRLTVHRELKEQVVLALVVGKDGPKFRESPGEAPPNPVDTEGRPLQGAGQVGGRKTESNLTVGTVGIRTSFDLANSSIHVEAKRMTMAYLVDMLMRVGIGNGHRVVDMTGLKGGYEVTFDLRLPARGGTDASVASAGQGPHPAEAASDPGSGGMLRSLKSLGLELQKQKAPVEQVIVDRVERTPTEN